MDNYLQKIQGGPNTPVAKKARWYAGLTTVVIVVIWLVLTSVFKKEEASQPQTENQSPDVQLFFQEAQNQINALGEAAQQQSSSFNQIFEQQQAAEEALNGEEQEQEQNQEIQGEVQQESELSNT